MEHEHSFPWLLLKRMSCRKNKVRHNAVWRGESSCVHVARHLSTHHSSSSFDARSAVLTQMSVFVRSPISRTGGHDKPVATTLNPISAALHVPVICVGHPGEIFLPKLKSAADNDDGDIQPGQTELVSSSSRRNRDKNRSMQQGGSGTGSALDEIFRDVPFPFNLVGGVVKVKDKMRMLQTRFCDTAARQKFYRSCALWFA